MIPYLLVVVLSPLSAQSQMGVSSAVVGSGASVIYPSSIPDFAPGTRLNLFPGISCGPETPLKLQIYPLGSSRSYAVQLINRPGCALQSVLPADLPNGPAELVLTTPDEQMSAYLRIVPFAMTIANDSLFLPGMKLTQLAIPGTRITLQTTGAGNTPESQLQVALGGLRFEPDAFRRSPSQAGIDEIDLTIPADASLAGCYVPLRIAAGDDSSHAVLVPVMPEPIPCTHALGLTIGQMATLDNRGSLPSAVLTLDNFFFSGDRAFLEVIATNSVVVANLAGPSEAPEFGCTLSPESGRTSLLRTNPSIPLLRAGFSSLDLKGPDGQTVTLTPQATDLPNWFRNTNSGRWLAAGEWSMEGLNWSFTLPPVWKPTIDRSLLAIGVLEWTWDPAGYTAGDIVTTTFRNGSQAITCLAEASSGSIHIDIPGDFDIPANLRSAFSGTLTRHSSMPLLQPFKTSETQPGLGLVIYRFTYSE
ncbi:MAG: hypothetical protein HY820_26180 [Acidobacteria bacterium]|nr:hypothetical protein [Acidobacteriota bacterium]